MLECFRPAVFLLMCRVRLILETARCVYSSKNEEKQTDLHMDLTRWREAIHVIGNNYHFPYRSQHLELVELSQL